MPKRPKPFVGCDQGFCIPTPIPTWVRQPWGCNHHLQDLQQQPCHLYSPVDN